LAQLAEVCGDDRQAAVCREISKLHNTTERDTLGNLRDYFTANQARGEIVIVVSGKVEAAETKVHRNKYRSDDNE
jgi:16S rRNA (cytidine1402-2'-O)-methyltransferase